MSSAHELINFPQPGGEWRDSGEGGQFVKLVVPEPEGWLNNCCVDASIVLKQPDVCHNGRELWEPYDHEANMTQHDVFQYMRRRLEDEKESGVEQPEWKKEFHRGIDYHKWGSWVLRANNPDHISVPVLAAVEMGSSQFSLWSESQSRYWLADEFSLTEAGQRVADSLHVAFGIAPILLTFLDT